MQRAVPDSDSRWDRPQKCIPWSHKRRLVRSTPFTIHKNVLLSSRWSLLLFRSSDLLYIRIYYDKKEKWSPIHRLRWCIYVMQTVYGITWCAVFLLSCIYVYKRTLTIIISSQKLYSSDPTLTKGSIIQYHGQRSVATPWSVFHCALNGKSRFVYYHYYRLHKGINCAKCLPS